MMSWKKLEIVLALLLLLVACERTSREFAGTKKETAREIQYKTTTNVAMLAGASHREDVAPKSASSAPDGAALYARTCVACHQMTGQGVPGAFPPLDGSPYVVGDKVERLAAIMIYGLSGPINVNGIVYTSAMPPLGATLKDEEFAAIASYVRSSWSNKASAVDTEVFAAVRKKYGTRAMFAISELGEER